MVGALSGVLAPCPPAAADDAAARFYEGLRQRRLFGLAEGELLDRLENGRLNAEQRVDVTIELSRTFLEHARYAVGEEQVDLWQRAASVVSDLLRAAPQSPWRPMLEFQQALVPAARGELLGSRLELTPLDAQLLAETRGVLDEAVAGLSGVAKSLDAELSRATAARRTRTDGITPYELRGLLIEARYRLGVAHLERSQLFPASSPERAASLIDAENWLKQVAGGPPGELPTLNSQVRLAEVSRLRGDFQRAERLLIQVESDKPPREISDAAKAERVRVLLASGKAPEAAAMLAEYRRAQPAVPGELQYLNVEALAALRRIAVERGDADLAKRLSESTESFVVQAERESGGYWGYRSRALLERVHDEAIYGPELAGLIQQARALYAGGRHEDAVAAYRAAQDAARQSGQTQTAFNLGYTRASIQLETARYPEAARSFLALAAEFPAVPQATDAHLLGAWCLGRVYDDQATKDNRLAYTQALLEHRERYAASPTQHDAGWMLGLLEERRLQATAALRLYRTIPAEHRRGAAAQAAVARCHEAILTRLHDLLRTTPAADRQREIRALLERTEQEAVAELTRLVEGYSESPAALVVEQAEVCLRLARMLLNRSVPEYARADALLERVFHSGETTPTSAQGEATANAGDSAAWKPLLRTAAQLRIVSLAGQGEFQRAEELVRSLSGSQAADVLGILAGLSEMARDTSDNTRFHVGQLQLRAAAELDARRSELSADEQQQLDLCLAEAYVAGGQSRDGIARYERVLAAQPGNDLVRRRLAEVLEEACGTSECLEKARQHWRRLESTATPGTPEWMEARYHIIHCLLGLRDREAASKLLAITKLLYPDLGGELLQPRFAKLEDELGRPK